MPLDAQQEDNFTVRTRISIRVCQRPLSGFLADIEAFHGHLAPGLVLGGFMVDWAQQLVGRDVEADAVVETFHCLPDAIQIFTPCTVGNGWLKILDWDKFALSLYNKSTLTGYRVWLDLNKARRFPNLFNWYMRKVPKKELPLDVLLETILEARRDALSSRAIHMKRYHEPRRKGRTAICPGCGEAFPIRQGLRCLSCQGGSYYSPR